MWRKLCILPWCLGFVLIARQASGASLIAIDEAWQHSSGEVWEQQAAAQDLALRAWVQPGFEPWAQEGSGASPANGFWQTSRGGFVGGPTLLEQATRLTDFGPGKHTILFRKTFEVADLDAIQDLVLRLQYKHGLLLWLNGHLILQEGFASLEGSQGLGSPEADPFPIQALAAWRPDNLFEERDLSHAVPWLVEGTNVLAAQVHASINQLSMAFVAELNANFARPPSVHQLTSHTAVVSWRTLQPKSATLHYGLTPRLTQHLSLPQAVLEPEITLKSLHPGRRYYWQVALEDPEGVARSPMKTFSTPDPEADHVSFAVIGDSGLGTLAQYDVAQQIRASGADLVLTTGDTVYPSLVPELVDLRFYSLYHQGQQARPIYPSVGNHDWYQGKAMFAQLYHLPANASSAQEHAADNTTPESYYQFEQGPAAFFALCVPFLYQYDISGSAGETQLAWLEQALRASDRPWKILYLHHPIVTSSSHLTDDYNGNQIPDILDVRQAILPLAQQYGVQFIFAGHDHVYERFAPMGGVVPVTTAGGGGRLYGLRSRDPLSQQFQSVHHLVHVAINGDEATLRAIDSQGTILDRYTFTRSLSQTQQPVDEAPDPDADLGSHAEPNLDPEEEPWLAPALKLYASWYGPEVESAPANDGDGNLLGQVFDFYGSGIPSTQGSYSSAGCLHAHADATHLYLGIDSIAIPDHGSVMLLLGQAEGEPPHSAWAPWQTTLETLDWTPSLVGVFGDERADQSSWEGAASLASNNPTQASPRPAGPQGLFLTGPQWVPVAGARLQQYNLSPQITPAGKLGTHLMEQNAQYVEAAIPWESLPGIGPGATLKVALISGHQPSQDPSIPWSLDSSQLGMRPMMSPEGHWQLVGLDLVLPEGPDTDGDGLDDPTESRLETLATQPDSDGDGLPDGWEVAMGLDPGQHASPETLEGDQDHDGASLLEEWIAGTHPLEPSSTLRLELNLIEPGILELAWDAQPGRAYRLEASATLRGPYQTVAAWEAAEATHQWDRSNFSAAHGTHSTPPRRQRHYLDLGPGPDLEPNQTGRRFYRLSAELSPDPTP